MRSPTPILALGLIAMFVPVPASPASKWTLSGLAGVSAGDQTTASFSWRASVVHWRTPGAGIGLEFGRLRWEGKQESYAYPADANSVPFQGLAKGGHELFDLSGSLRIRDSQESGTRGVPFIALGAGAYMQSVPNGTTSWPYEVPEDDDFHIGWHVAFGGMGIQGLAPGAQFRFDWVNTSPGPSAYFTASAALHVNR